MPKRRNDEPALEDDDIEDDDKMLPPHEIVARGSECHRRPLLRSWKGSEEPSKGGILDSAECYMAQNWINSISKRIEELQDKELQPQLEELIQGLSRMWEAMFQCHKLQFQIMSTTYSNKLTENSHAI
ncbi:hypothetical protein K1719_000085 [Acacia pycnantha]|nr:hypothetical protein K1719_000085 [Acacia pycnantha]